MKIFNTIFSFLLAGVLLAATAGFSVSRHYCMGDLVSENYYALNEQGCGDSTDTCGKDAYKSSCCEDEHLNFEGVEIISQDKDHQTLLIAAGSDFYKPASVSTEFSFTAGPGIKPNPPPAPPKSRQILIRQQRFLT